MYLRDRVHVKKRGSGVYSNSSYILVLFERRLESIYRLLFTVLRNVESATIHVFLKSEAYNVR